MTALVLWARIRLNHPNPMVRSRGVALNRKVEADERNKRLQKSADSSVKRPMRDFSLQTCESLIQSCQLEDPEVRRGTMAPSSPMDGVQPTYAAL